MRETQGNLTWMLILALFVAVAGCGGSDSSTTGGQSSITEPETGMAEPGHVSGNAMGAISLTPGDFDAPVLTNPLGIPQTTPDQPGTAAGTTIPGTEHFIASSIFQDTDPETQATVSFLALTLQRNPESTLFDVQAEQFTVEIDGDAEWTAIPHYCKPSIADERNKMLICSLDGYYESYPFFFQQGTINILPRQLQFQPSSAGVVSITTVYPAGVLPQGTYPAVATVEQFTDPEALTREVWFVADEIPEVIDMVPTIISFRLSTDQYGKKYDSSLTIDFSSEIIIDDWTVKQAGGSFDHSQQCVLANNIHCELNGLSNRLLVSLTIRVPYGPNHSINATVPQQVGEQDISDNNLIIDLESSYSSDVLQELINTANEGDVVEFPAGIYTGRLDAKGKNLTILGATGVDNLSASNLTPIQDHLPTVIQVVTRKYTESFAASPNTTYQSIRQINYEPVLIDLGDESHVSGIEFRTRGQSILGDSGKAITFSNNIVKPVPERLHDMDVLVIDSGRTCWVNNRIEDWGSGENNICEKLINGLNDNTTETTQMLSNLFINNNCREGLFSSEHKDFSLESDTKMVIKNNTLINNPLILGLSGHSGSRFIDFRNNLIFGSSILGSYNDLGDNSRLISSSNLIWNSTLNDLFAAELIDPEQIIWHAPNINLNPMFSDPDNGDYRLRAGSPAVDSGTTLADFDPVSAASATPLNQTCHHITLDGNLDGNSEPDIGALEYDPAQ